MWDRATLTLTGGGLGHGQHVFTLQIHATSQHGGVHLDLLAPVQHTAPGTEDDTTFNVTATVTDAEGDSATGTFTVLIDDDPPVADEMMGDWRRLTRTRRASAIGTVAGLLSQRQPMARTVTARSPNDQRSPLASTGGTVTIDAGNIPTLNNTSRRSRFAVCDRSWRPSPTRSRTATATPRRRRSRCN